MAGSPISWLKARYLTGELPMPEWARRRWPDLRPDPSPLQAQGLARIALARSGAEFRGTCPVCGGSLVVGRERWLCLDCCAQERLGSDERGLLRLLKRRGGKGSMLRRT